MDCSFNTSWTESGAEATFPSDEDDLLVLAVDFVIDLISADADTGLLLVNVFNGCSSQALSSSSQELVS